MFDVALFDPIRGHSRRSISSSIACGKTWPMSMGSAVRCWISSSDTSYGFSNTSSHDCGTGASTSGSVMRRFPGPAKSFILLEIPGDQDQTPTSKEDQAPCHFECAFALPRNRLSWRH